MRLRIMILLSVACLGLQLSAEDAAPASDGLANTTVFEMFQPGDALLTLSAGTSLGIGFLDATGQFVPANLDPAVSIGLSLSIFLDNHWALGGEFSGLFFTTIADRQYFCAPFAARLTYAFDLDPFAISPFVALGMAVNVLDDMRSLNPLVRVGSAFTWRFNTEVSYGLNLDCSLIPEIYADPAYQSHALFMFGATLSATYHL